MMAMKGIDVSHWNGWPMNTPTKAAYKDARFVVCKATQGTNFTDPQVHNYARQTLKDGKLLGFYHYATGTDPVNEAKHFLNVVAPYKGKAVLALDWEYNQNNAWGNGAWAKSFLDYVAGAWNVTPLLYVQYSALGQVAQCAKYPLWLARYPKDADSWLVPDGGAAKTGAWKAWTVWQFTSSGGKIDRNTSHLTPEGWRALATPETLAQKKAKASKTIPQIVEEVLAGKWGNGEQRKQRLLAAGYPYTTVQEMVNARVRAPKTFNPGDRVRVQKGAPIYGTSNKFAQYVYQNVYTVYQANGNRVVFAAGRVVIGAVDGKYLSLEGK